MKKLHILILSMCLSISLAGCSDSYHYEVNISSAIEKILTKGERSYSFNVEQGYEYDFADFDQEALSITLNNIEEASTEESTEESTAGQDAVREGAETLDTIMISNELKVCKGVIFNLNNKLVSLYNVVGSNLEDAFINEDRSMLDAAVIKFRFTDDPSNVWCYIRSDGDMLSRPWETSAIPVEYYDIYPVVTGEFIIDGQTGEYRQFTMNSPDVEGQFITLNDTYFNIRGGKNAVVMLHFSKILNTEEYPQNNIIDEDLVNRALSQFEFVTEIEEEVTEDATLEETTDSTEE